GDHGQDIAGELRFFDFGAAAVDSQQVEIDGGADEDQQRGGEGDGEQELEEGEGDAGGEERGAGNELRSWVKSSKRHRYRLPLLLLPELDELLDELELEDELEVVDC